MGFNSERHINIAQQIGSMYVPIHIDINNIRYVLGIGKSEWIEKDKNIVCLTGVIWDKVLSKEVESVRLVDILEHSYEYGKEGFRLSATIQKLITLVRHKIDVIILKANGRLHEYKAGLASFIGSDTGIPTIGFVESVPKIQGLKISDCGNLISLGNEIVARKVKKNKQCKSIWVSAGYIIDTKTSCLLVEELIQKIGNTPECVRLANINARIFRKNNLNNYFIESEYEFNKLNNELDKEVDSYEQSKKDTVRKVRRAELLQRYEENFSGYDLCLEYQCRLRCDGCD